MAQDICRRNNVTMQGGSSGRTVLFAHGFGGDQHSWRHVAQDFARDHRVVLFDYVGCGRSDLQAWSAERYHTLSGYVQDLLDVCDALQLSRVTLVGHAISGVIGLLASLRRPDLFSQLVMVGPSPRYLNDRPDYHGGFEREDVIGLLNLMERNASAWAEAMAPMAVGAGAAHELGQEVACGLCATDPAICRHFAERVLMADNRADLPKVRVPSVILQGAHDALTPPEVGYYMHEHMPGSTLQMMPGMGHCPQLSHPHDTVAAIRDHLLPH
ncbi:MAG TPA: alpha/beta hydrolase [Candidatus Aquabacterium excrementipullorum]|nr:alpha/beta hydrolase [Candidatus Aquabacterium excrementipullorum]